MIENLIHFIKEKQLLKDNKYILLGISGGIDSMVMADIFLKAGIRFTIAHCNFGLRGEESDADENFIYEYAKEQSIKLFSKKMNTLAYAEKNKLSIQMAARELRIQFFENLCLTQNYQSYATAHHQDDALETFFINLIRGSGISGLRGILPQQGLCIHPMLFTNREEIKQYALENHIQYREDKTNAKTDYTRNKIRHQVLPILDTINPSFRKVMNGNLVRLHDTELIYRQKVNETLNTILSEKENQTFIQKKGLLQFDFPETYLFECISKFGFNISDVGQIIRGLDGHSGKQFFSPTHRLIIDREQLIISTIPTEPDNDTIIHITENETHISKPIGLTFQRLPKTNDFVPDHILRTAYLDADRLQFPLTLRKWKRGDSFIPLGMKGKKLLSDLFTDLKLSIPQKEEVFVLLSADHIFWVIGHRIDDRYKIRNQTKNIFQISMV